MIGLIVTGHGHFATGLTSAVTLVTGIKDGIIACDFDDASAFNSIRTKLENAVEALKDYDAVVIFCDLFSGTPFNQALDMKVSTGNEKINIVYGVNLPLLIEAALAASNEGTLEDILGKVDMAKQYSMGIVENKSADEDEDDF